MKNEIYEDSDVEDYADEPEDDKRIFRNLGYCFAIGLIIFLFLLIVIAKSLS